MVLAASLDANDLTNALRKGDFYASTGVILDSVTSSRAEYRIAIKEDPKIKYVTYFIGDQGKVLAKSLDLNPSYRRSGEKYVRARIEASTGDIAWTQPAFE
jgi:hypothetical protein